MDQSESPEKNESREFLLSVLLSLDPLVRANFQSVRDTLKSVITSVRERDPHILLDLVKHMIDVFVKENITGTSNSF